MTRRVIAICNLIIEAPCTTCLMSYRTVFGNQVCCSSYRTSFLGYPLYNKAAEAFESENCSYIPKLSMLLDLNINLETDFKVARTMQEFSSYWVGRRYVKPYGYLPAATIEGN